MENANRVGGRALKPLLESLGVDNAEDLQDEIGQLKSLKEHCRSMIDPEEPYCIWKDDCDALEIAIKALEIIKAEN